MSSTKVHWRKMRRAHDESPRAWCLFSADRQKLATVQESLTGHWFWYGMGRNTMNETKSFEMCKAEAQSVARLITTTGAVQRDQKPTQDS